MNHLVEHRNEAIENILRFRTEVAPQLAKKLTQWKAWYAAKSEDGTWCFAPSIFVGHAESSAEAYLSAPGWMQSPRTEAVLKEWFEVVKRDSPLGQELHKALDDFMKANGRPRPNSEATISVLKGASFTDAIQPETRNRIHFDAAICGGRPHIRGTRMRVSDILDLLASGVSRSEVLTDYPYLTEADVSAALPFGATADDHHIWR